MQPISFYIKYVKNEQARVNGERDTETGKYVILASPAFSNLFFIFPYSWGATGLISKENCKM